MSTHLDEVRRLEDQFAEAMTHMYAVGNDLARLRARLERERVPSTSAVPATVPSPPPGSAALPPAAPVAASTQTPSGAHGTPSPASAAPLWWQREGTVARALAVAGAAVTLIGVALLVTLAVQLGLFGPALRVTAGAVIAVGLVVTGHRVHAGALDGAAGRADSARQVGAVAIAATGYAAAYLDVMAVTVIYDWVPAGVGLALAGAVGVTGLLLAVWWDSQLLALVTVVGVMALGPVIGGGVTVTTAAFLLVMTVVAQPAQVGRAWPALHAARTVPTALILLAGASTGADLAGYTALAVLLAVIDLTTTLIACRHHAAGSVIEALVVVTSVPATVLALQQPRWAASALLGGLATAHLAAAVVAGPGTARLRLLLTATGSTLAVLTVLTVTSDQLTTTGLAVLAIGYASTAARTRSRLVGLAALAVSATAVVSYLPIVVLLLSRYEAGRWLTPLHLVESLLLLVLAGVVAWGGTSLTLPASARSMLSATTWLVALLASTGVTVSLGVLLSRPFDATGVGFVTGQALATVAWLAAAAYLLIHGLDQTEDASTSVRTGLVLAAVGVAKLLLYDLAALDGIVRVVAFLVAGVLLLTMGTGYAAALERARPPRTP